MLRVRPTPNQNFATVTFSVSDEAALAKEKGKVSVTSLIKASTLFS